ncbi:MAG: anaerobic sulfatase-maturation protein [Fimbriimonas sp.]|nr:anaerobic sulfatase-maturation protein [Fimbriimonas sp.]
MTKPNGAVCNLDCTYCYYLEKERLYPGAKSFRMTDEVLTSFIRQYIRAQSAPVVTFAWHGGEPTLLGIPFFERALEIQARYAKGKTIENAFQTNGVLLDDKWGEFLAKNKFLIGISIDGPEELHDVYRTNKGGRPTHSQVMRGLRVLQKHGVEFNTLSVVNRKNSYQPLEVYHFLKEIGSEFIQFIPIVEQLASEPDEDGIRMPKPYANPSSKVADWSVEPLQYGIFLQTIFDEWVRHDADKIYVQMFDVALQSWLNFVPSLCVFAPTCGNAMAMEHNGDLYSCDHFVYPEDKLGNIMELPLAKLAASPQQFEFGNAKRDTLPAQCRNCDYRFACNGGCPKHRFLETKDGEPGLNYLCEGYMHFFRHAAPYMEIMANEFRLGRSPANVMPWARKKDTPA